MIGIKYVTKTMFFQDKNGKVLVAVAKATRSVLSKFGAYVRTAARSRIRKRKRVSEPGETPSSHTGLLKKFIFFGYDPGRRSVVIGPMRLNQKAGDAPEALEYGGISTSRVGSRRRHRRTEKKYVRARPFMAPALAQERPKLPAMWRDSIK